MNILIEIECLNENAAAIKKEYRQYTELTQVKVPEGTKTIFLRLYEELE